MKLIQLNIWQGKILIAVNRFLKEQDADFVCLQEVFSSDTFIGILDMLSSLETLKSELEYPFVYYEPTRTFETSGVKARIGNALFSKFPLSDQRVVFTNNSFQNTVDWTKSLPNTRSILFATVTLPNNEQFTLATHHGYAELDPLGSEITVESMTVAASELKKVNGPLVFAGDLNIKAESPAMRQFDGWLEDLTATHHITDTLTEFGKVRNVPCDHILVSKEVKVKRFEVSPALVSDHSPLILEFEI